MKSKTIKKLLTGVMNNFLESIKTDEVCYIEIREIIKTRSFITGGCIPSMLMDDWVNDYDIYFCSKEDAEKVKEYFKESHTRDTEDKYHVNLITDNAINLSDKIQLITKFTGNPSFVTEKFDWQHIKSYFYFNEEKDDYKLVLTEDVYRLICEKELIYTGSEYPLSSLMRLKKYIKKGWSVSNTTIMHIALDFVDSMNTRKAKRHKQNSYNSFAFEVDEQESYTQHNTKEDSCEHEINYNVDDIIYHLNGVDPVTVQKELAEFTGKYLSIKEVVKIMNGE